MKLLQAEQLQDLSWLWGHLVNTDESGNKKKLCFWLHEEVSTRSGLSSKANEVGLTSMILLQVLNGARLQFTTLGGVNL